MSIGADYRPRILLTVRGAADTIWQMGNPPKPPPPSPTSSGSSTASPQNPGAAAPTFIDTTQPVAIVVTAEFSDTLAGREAGEALMKSIRRKRHARECGGVIRLDRK